MNRFYWLFFGVAVLLSSCGGAKRAKEIASTIAQIEKMPCTDPQKIISIDREHVYDLSGYADEGDGDPFRLFDENAFVDPRTESKFSENYIPVSNPQPKEHPQIYFSKNTGSRIVTDLRVPFRLSDVYIYDKSLSSDSVWIYTGDMKHWKLKAALETRREPGAWGWRKFSIDDSSQFVMIRFSSWESNITEMVLYGCPYKTIPLLIPPGYSGPRLPKKTMKEFVGANYVWEQEPQWIKPFHYSRLYSFALDYDNDTVHAYPNIQYNMLHYGPWDEKKRSYHFLTDDLQKENNGVLWLDLMGGSTALTKKGFGNPYFPMNEVGMDPEDPASYARHANMLWHMAAFFGKTKVDTNLLSLSHAPRQTGRGTISLFENGNETNAPWAGDQYWPPTAYFALSTADYDGDEKRLGARTGIINADPESKLMTCGMVELDTNRVRIYKFLCNQLRGDQAFVWKGGIQYHHYSNKKNQAITPEEDSLRWRLSKVRDATYRIQPGVECILGENGYDKSRFSSQAAPLIPGLTASESQGIFIMRSINAAAFSGFDAYILFWLRDPAGEDNHEKFLSCGLLGPDGKGGTKVYPGWFYISTFVNRLGNYTADSILSEKGNVWVYRYRNKSAPDSVAYFVYSPTKNGTHVKGYSLKTGNAAGVAEEIYLSNDAVSGESIYKQYSKGEVKVDVEEKPKLILMREKN